MKKITTLIVTLIFVYALSYGQSQRLVLCEEFTQASCPPCAAQNPAYNTLLNNNPTKVISIKHQTSWPGVDPMNAQNPTDVQTRVTYYAVNGVPTGLFDGVEHAGANYLGAPANATQAMIDNEYAVPSPFTIAVNKTISSGNDTIYASVLITCTQAVSGTLMARIAVVERDINFTTAPGTNGETHFESVLKKMLPSASGTALPTSWTVGQTQTINVSWRLTNVYNLNELSVVAYIQDDVDKSVKQAGFAAPSTVTNYGGVAGITVPTFQCSTTLNPSVSIVNLGTANLTSATVNYKVDNGPVSTAPWTGSLATNATANVSLPSSTVTGGAHTFNAYLTNPNFTSTNSNAMSFNLTAPFSIVAAPVSAPIVEGYQTATFPPTNWIRMNPDNGPTWTRVTTTGGFQNSSASTRMDFYSSGAGNVDELIMPNLNLTSTSGSVQLTFSVAYAQYSNENDRLEVLVSTDCGQNWLPTSYDKSGSTLMTHVPVGNNTVFLPAVSADWRAETVDLTSFTGNNVLVKFKATSAFGNDLYVDDINLQYLTGIAQPAASASVDVYPNPSNGTVNVNLNLTASQYVMINVYNSLGEVVASKEVGTTSGGLYPFNLSQLASGNYVVQVLTGKISTLTKITLNK
jgi:hypothetical protein